MNTITLFLVVGILGIVACLILIVVGLTWQADTRVDKRKAKPAAKAPEAAAAPPAPLAAPTSSIAARADNGAREVLRVLRDPISEALLVEVAGQRYQQMGDIRLSSVREGLLNTLRDLEAFAGGAPTTPPPVMVVHTPTPEPTPVRPSITNVGAAKAGQVGTAPLLAPSMNPFKQMLVLRDLAKTQLPPMKTIAEQIDEILQEKLVASPHAQRGVKVHTGPKGNALFRADGEDYDAVDSVPDEGIRALIRAAVAEWEMKQ
jgi:hypothetical protein